MASYHPIEDINLRRRSTCSFDTANIPGLEAWLYQRGYEPLPVRSRLEYARLKRGGSLIVAYHSGAIVVQGSDVADAMALLAELEVSE